MYKNFYRSWHAAFAFLFICILLTACGNAAKTNTHTITPSNNCLRNSFTEDKESIGSYRITPDNPTQSQVIWSYCSKQNGKSTIPISAFLINDGQAFFTCGECGFHLGAVDAHSGTLLWTYSLSNDIKPRVGFLNQPAFGNGLIYVSFNTLAGTALCAVESTSGKQRWCQFYSAYTVSSPVYSEGVIAINTLSETSNHMLYVLDASNGSNLYQMPNMMTNAQSVDGLLYAVTSQNTLLAFDPQTGHIRWTGPESVGADAGNWSPPWILHADDLLYFANQDHTLLYALDARTGHELWQSRIDSSIWESFTLSGHLLYLVTRIPPHDTTPDTVQVTIHMHAIDAQTGQERWHADLQNETVPDPTKVPVIVGHLLYITTFSSKGQLSLHAFEAQTGKQAWERQYEGDIILAGPVITQGILLLTTESNNLNTYHIDHPIHFYVLDAQTGKALP